MFYIVLNIFFYVCFIISNFRFILFNQRSAEHKEEIKMKKENNVFVYLCTCVPVYFTVSLKEDFRQKFVAHHENTAGSTRNISKWSNNCKKKIANFLNLLISTKNIDLGTNHVISGPKRGLEKNCIRWRKQTDRQTWRLYDWISTV